MAVVFAGLVPFAAATCASPGPNNLMVAASGANFGLRATVPHMLGVIFGLPVLILAAGVGLGALFGAYPLIHTILKVAGSAYLLYLAWRIAVADGSSLESRTRPFTFVQAVLFQWVNPQAWVLAVSSLSAYTRGAGGAGDAAVVGLVFAACTVPTLTVWALFGRAIAGRLRSRRARRIFNGAMAAVLAASLIPIVR